jgi:hypothetical protein
MHKRTFEALERRYDESQCEGFVALASRFGITKKFL